MRRKNKNCTKMQKIANFLKFAKNRGLDFPEGQIALYSDLELRTTEKKNHMKCTQACNPVVPKVFSHGPLRWFLLLFSISPLNPTLIKIKLTTTKISFARALHTSNCIWPGLFHVGLHVVLACVQILFPKNWRPKYLTGSQKKSTEGRPRATYGRP